jgi:hypothetical protein
MSLGLTNATMQLILAKLVEAASAPDVAGPLSTIKVALFTAVSGGIRRGMAYADFTLATFDGYAASGNITWGTAVLLADGNWWLVGDAKAFVMTGLTTQETILGYFGYLTGSPNVVRFAELFDTPDPFTQIGDSVTVVPKFRCPVDGFGGATVIN